MASNLIQTGLKISLECIGRGKITTIEGPWDCGKTRAAAQMVASLVRNHGEVIYASEDGEFKREIDRIKHATEFTYLQAASIVRTSAEDFSEFLQDGCCPDILVIDDLESCVMRQYRDKALEMIRERVTQLDGTHIIVVRRG